MKASLIALVAFQVNAAYMTSQGKQPLHPGNFEDAPQEYRDGLVKFIDASIADASVVLPPPAEDASDADKAVHAGQSAMFRALVDALKDIPDIPDEAPARTREAPDGKGYTPIKYIGRRESYRDGAYGTGIVWKKGETQLVPAEKAALMLKHADVYMLGDPLPDTTVPPEVIVRKGDESDDPVQQVRDSIMGMNKEGVVTYAKTHYRVDFDKRQGVAALRQQLVQLVDQFGVS